MKKKNIFVYTTIILALIVIGLVVYIIYDKTTKDEEIIERVEPTPVNKEVVKELDITNCINGVEGVTYSKPKVVTSAYGLEAKVNDDKLGVTVSVDGTGVFNKNVSTITSNERDESNYNLIVNGFDKEIAKVFIGEFGQDATGLSLIYLMKDKTVSYTRLFKKNYDENNNLFFTLNNTAVDNNNYVFGIDGDYSEIKDIVGIYNVGYSIPNGGGASTVIASIKDGSFYDLSKFMEF